MLVRSVKLNNKMLRVIFVLIMTVQVAFAANPLVVLPASLGSSSIHAATVDAAGNIYVTGSTIGFSSADNHFVPTPGAIQTTFNKGSVCDNQTPSPPCSDAFVAKLNATGELIYATFLGGSGVDEGFAIAVDSVGNAYVTGHTYSSDFPITANALQKTNAGPTVPPFNTSGQLPAPGGDVFVAKLNPSGTALLYSTFLGGNNHDWANSISIDAQGSVFIAGGTMSSDFPVTAGAYAQKLFPGFSSGFVSKINSAGTALVYSTYFSAEIQAMARDAVENVYLTGTVRGYSYNTFSATPGAFQNRAEGPIRRIRGKAQLRWSASLRHAAWREWQRICF